ncbi:hypothetical protein G7Y89_g7244 [Cudoniella acicularis]|uniref:Berberine/berberine-like domain-containing protein n=1 Tax=Cudoniella acicularis TaxID=354080 RepID=A0A8H4RKT8_9HELO|nr:hypothetical protein G7Y89_g7244 [Cudoniella acicularis]
MGSNFGEVSVMQRNGEILSNEAIQQLKLSIAGHVLVKGKAAEQTYLYRRLFRGIVHRNGSSQRYGGGSGPLTSQYGLAIDNLLAVKAVIADGSVLSCSENENSDLFWAIRGGGSNFGVVTEFKYRVHKQGDVLQILNLIETFQKLVDGSEGKLLLMVAFIKTPGMPSVHPICLVFYDGPGEDAIRITAPLWEAEPVASMVAMHEYADITKPSDFVNGPPSHQNYSTSNALMYVPPKIDVIERLIGDFDAFMTKYGAAVSPSRIGIEIRSYAKSASISPSATALAARRPATLVLLEAHKVKDSVREEGLEKGGSNFVNANIADGTVKALDMFGENLPRLRELKRKYEPNFVFNKWYPIPPAEAEA